MYLSIFVIFIDSYKEWPKKVDQIFNVYDA